MDSCTTKGPPRYYKPICILTNLGYYGGPRGYLEVESHETGFITVDEREKNETDNPTN